jgi:hypothetical protein
MAESLPPAGAFVDDNLVNLFTETIEQLMADLGRAVTLRLPPLTLDCPNCGWDHIHQRSSNIYTPNASGVTLDKSFPPGQRCPVCKGQGKLQFKRDTTYTALIGKNPRDDEFDYAAHGLVPSNVVRTKTVGTSFSDMEITQFIIIDDVEYEKVTFPIKTGLRDLNFVKVFWKRRNS